MGSIKHWIKTSGKAHFSKSVAVFMLNWLMFNCWLKFAPPGGLEWPITDHFHPNKRPEQSDTDPGCQPGPLWATHSWVLHFPLSDPWSGYIHVQVGWADPTGLYFANSAIATFCCLYECHIPIDFYQNLPSVSLLTLSGVNSENTLFTRAEFWAIFHPIPLPCIYPDEDWIYWIYCDWLFILSPIWWCIQISICCKLDRARIPYLVYDNRRFPSCWQLYDDALTDCVTLYVCAFVWLELRSSKTTLCF